MIDKGSILVVDDTRESLDLLTHILLSAGYQVRAADNGALALVCAAACRPELILLDICMPDMDGFEVLRLLMANEEIRETPVIFISAVTETEQRVKGLKLGAVDFITKPFQREELLARVHTHLTLSRLRDGFEKQAAALRLANEKLQHEMTERTQAQEDREKLILELQGALEKIRTLKGLLPICSNCKKIRDDHGYWNRIEKYITEHSEAAFTHGICPECARKLYPELYKHKDSSET
jgi:DNA-binding response OmpR family regulator